LRCILRSLGYSPTVSKTIHPLDFASFLEIAKEEHNSSDELTEITKALKALHRDRMFSIPISEFRSILTSIGERMSHLEVDNLLEQVLF
uniref:EF-hand domain-containing protein n=1 Tax=Angiostrongylus cantonensis TaxID=6313 RepID=A0A0K0CXU1_ANGCA